MLTRVAPIILERFLTRIAEAGLLRCDPAPVGDDGFFCIHASPDVHSLPSSLMQLPTTAATRTTTASQLMMNVAG